MTDYAEAVMRGLALRDQPTVVRDLDMDDLHDGVVEVFREVEARWREKLGWKVKFKLSRDVVLPTGSYYMCHFSCSWGIFRLREVRLGTVSLHEIGGRLRSWVRLRGMPLNLNFEFSGQEGLREALCTSFSSSYFHLLFSSVVNRLARGRWLGRLWEWASWGRSS